MINDNINISSILTHFESVVRKEVSKNCYASTLPSTLKEGVKSMVVITCGNTVVDRNAYGEGTIFFYLYAQPVNGMMNVAALSKLEKSLRKALYEDKFDNEDYSVSREIYLGGEGYDTTYNMHYYIKSVYFKIK